VPEITFISSFIHNKLPYWLLPAVLTPAFLSEELLIDIFVLLPYRFIDYTINLTQAGWQLRIRLIFLAASAASLQQSDSSRTFSNAQQSGSQ